MISGRMRITARESGRALAALLAAALAACAGRVAETGAAPAIAVAVRPPFTAVQVNDSVTFAATVTGAATTSVTWSVVPPGCGSVTPAGVYTAPASAGSCQVRATSDADPGRSGTAAVAVLPAGGSGICNSVAGQLFPPAAPWNVPIDQALLDLESSAIIGYLAANHTSSSRFQITFDFNVLYADAGTTKRAFTQTGDFFDPDCDPAPVPVPVGGRLEGEQDYACASNGDCHLTVISGPECRLYEMWRANISGGTATGTFSGGCQAIWNLALVPPPDERGDFCTSADAAGLPILPLIFSADEVASGTIEHALRFILPNALIRRFILVRPATHSTDATLGPDLVAPPYGVRVRLKATKDISGLSAGAQVIARALKKYGMILADGGNVTFTAATDDLTVHKWGPVDPLNPLQVGVTSGSLKSLSWNDFEVVDLGARIDYRSGSCNRTPITQ
jgi:hypothetical protein